MNLLRIVKLIIISTLPLTSLGVYAANSPHFCAGGNDIIHTTIIKTGGKIIPARATLWLGTQKTSSCYVTLFAGKFLYDFEDNTEVPVDGQCLASVGLDYTCAQETFEPLHGTAGKPVSIHYNLISDKEKGIYTAAEPSKQEVKLSSKR